MKPFEVGKSYAFVVPPVLLVLGEVAEVGDGYIFVQNAVYWENAENYFAICAATSPKEVQKILGSQSREMPTGAYIPLEGISLHAPMTVGVRGASRKSQGEAIKG